MKDLGGNVYQSEISRWSANGELHQQRRLGALEVEVYCEAREAGRINGGLRLAETAIDGLHALHGVVAARVQSTPSLDYAAHRILETVEMACSERIVRYMLDG